MERPAYLNRPLNYPIPWDVVFRLTPYLRANLPCSFDEISRAVAERAPAPLVEGELPEDPRFVLAVNHYERPGLWIAHSACALTQIVRRRYGPADPPVRWVVTANWPPLRVGPLRIPSPGDLLLPRVARVLSCYAVPFSGSDPAGAAVTLKRLLGDAPGLDRPIGLFPEGVRGRAGEVGKALPGTGRLLKRLARTGFSVQPAGISEAGRFVFRFGETMKPEEVIALEDPASAVMNAIRRLTP